jgi:transposase
MTQPVGGQITIGVDPHKASWTAAAVDARQRVLKTVRVPASAAGYAQLRRFAAGWPQAVWAVEGATGLGLALTQYLDADGVTVLDVPAKLAARVRVLGHGHGRKNDSADAASAAVAAMTSTKVHPVALSPHAQVMRLLSERRDTLVAARTQAVNRLHALICQLTAGGAPRRLSASHAARLLETVHATDEVSRTAKAIALDTAADIARLDTQIKTVSQQTAETVTTSGTTLTSLYGIGPVLAATIIGRTGDISRFSTAAQFASYTGTAPIEVSSGDIKRHRLSRAGDRQLNRALHIMALVQSRRHEQGKAYYQKKRASGKTHLEALRCLKRRLADTVYRQLIHDHQQKGGPGRTPGGDSKSSAASPTPNS